MFDELEEFLSWTESPKAPTRDLCISDDFEGDDPEEFLQSFSPKPIEEPKLPTVKLEERHLRPQYILDTFDKRHTGEEGDAALLQHLVKTLEGSGPYSMLDVPAYLDQLRVPVCSGVYALYYRGDLDWYQGIRSLASTLPVYVGSSAGAGTNSVRVRLSLHYASLSQVSLPLEDFTFRFLLMPKPWAKWSEEAFLNLFRPTWNNMGFGSRLSDGAASENRSDSCSEWDTIHPGRDGAGTQLSRKAEDVIAKVRDQYIPASRHAYFKTKGNP